VAKAKIQLAAVWATCPKCGGDLVEPDSGSMMIAVGHYNEDTEFECIDCDKKWKLEAKAWK